MSSYQWLRFLTMFLFFSADGRVVAQPLGVNPSAAASDVRNPSSTNPSAAASDIRNPSATNPSAAASQIPQPSAISSRRDNLTPSIGSQRIAPQTRRARAVHQGRRERVKSRDSAGVEMTRPFEALEGARRDRIEFEKRAANDKVQQQRMEKEQKAKQAGEKRSEATAKRAQGARPAPTTAPSEKTIPPSPAGQHSAPKP
jgi:hypothetical protein